jgi:DNA repair exonuclease SbcCD ATPase subunit
MANETNIKVLKIELDTGTGELKVNGLTKSVKQLDKSVKDFAAQSKNAVKDGLNPMIDKTGLAGATVVELGRTISDSNYGIRGMANNLSQLSTLFITLITTTGGFANGMTALFTALAGPLGIIIALQTVITLLEKFSMESDKAKKSVDELTKSLEFQSTKLDFLGRFALGSADALAALRREYKELDEFLSSLPEGADQLAQNINFAIKQQQRLLDVRASISNMTKQLTDEENKLSESQRSELIYDLVDAYELESEILRLLQPQQEIGIELTADATDADKKRKDAIEELLKKFRELAIQTAKDDAARKKWAATRLKEDVNAFAVFAENYTKDAEARRRNEERVELFRQERLAKEAEYAKALGAIVTGIADNVDASYQKEIDIEKNKTTALNNQLKERLANEQLSADERAKIQSQIAANDEKLRKKQEEIERKQFKANKAAAIAEATISTFLAANNVLAQTKGGSVARIAGMIAVIGTGLANVAMIAKQQFVSSQSNLSSAGVGTNGTSGGVQAPDFNIVGQSASNQLAEAVKGQLSQPIKTYVVSKDVSTAQEMERNIIGSASLG